MKARIKETGEIVELAQEVIGHKGEQWKRKLKQLRGNEK